MVILARWVEAAKPAPAATVILISKPPNDECSGAVHRAAARLPWWGISSPRRSLSTTFLSTSVISSWCKSANWSAGKMVQGIPCFSSRPMIFVLVLLVLIHASPAAAFGAGNIGMVQSWSPTFRRSNKLQHQFRRSRGSIGVMETSRTSSKPLRSSKGTSGRQ